MEKVKKYSNFNDLKASHKSIKRSEKKLTEYDLKLKEFFDQLQNAAKTK